MTHVPCQVPRLLRAVSLISVYSLLPTISVISALVIRPAIAQTPPTSPAAPDDRPTNQDLLEQARQRLIERGGTPIDTPIDIPVPLPNSGTAPVAPPADSTFDSYRLGPGDGLFVNVFRFPDLSFQTTLDLQGNIVAPLAGVISLNGLTVRQAQDRIRNALNQYVVNPTVEITLIAQRAVEVTVAGEVVRPGFYPLPAPQLTTALLSAGGTTTLADIRNVVIRRSLRDGSTLERSVDLYTPLQASTAIPDIQLQDGDTVIVPTLTAENSEAYDRNLVANSTLARTEINIRVLNYATATSSRNGRSGQLQTVLLPSGSRFVDALTVVSPNVDSADLDSIALIRFDLAQGKAVSRELDGGDALRGDSAQNPSLEHNDVIVIGRNFVSRLTYALNTITQPFRDVLGFLLFFDRLGEGADDVFGGDDDD